MAANFIACAAVDRDYKKQLGFDVAVTWPSKAPTHNCTFVHQLTVVDVYEIPRNQRPEFRSLPHAEEALRSSLRGQSITFEVDGPLFDEIVCHHIGSLGGLAGINITRWDWSESLEKATNDGC